MRRKTRQIIASVAILAFLTGVACNDPYSQARISRRQYEFNELAEMVQKSEAKRPERTRESLNDYAKWRQQRKKDFAETLREVGYHIW